MDYITLSNGIKMPVLGYGVYQVTKAEVERCVSDALEVGYRSIDTAQSYFNEEEVGNAIAKSGIPRGDIFLTTKVWIEHYGYEAWKNRLRNSRLITLISCCFISPSETLTEPGGLWKSFTNREF